MSTLLDDISEILGGTRYEDYLAVCCPYHGDSHPSMMVYEDRFICKSCGANGPTIKLLNKVRQGGVQYSYGHEDELHTPNPFGGWMKKDSLQSVLKRAWVHANLNPGMTVYIRETRGIRENIRRSLGIGVLSPFFTFPVLNPQHKVIGAFARSNGEVATSRYFVPKGQNPNLLYVPSWKRVTESNTVFITFGPIDAISLYCLGFASLSTLSGKTLDFTALDSLRKRIVFIPDYGEDREAHRLAAKLGWRGTVCDFPYPEHTKDMNDVYLKQPELIINTLQEYTNNGHKLDGRLRDCNRTDPEQRTVRECGETGPVLSSV